MTLRTWTTPAVVLALWAVLGAGSARAQVAVSTEVGAAVVRDVALGWSAKRQILGKAVYNDQNQRIGTISDLIIAPDTSVSYVIVGAGGFVGLGHHDVAVPNDKLSEQQGKFVLAGATRDEIKSMPPFQYPR